MAKFRPSVGRRYRQQSMGYGAVDYKHDDSVIGFSTAREFYNFDASSGALRTGYGVSAHPAVPVAAARYWVYRLYSDSAGGYVDRYLVQYSNGYVAARNMNDDECSYISGKTFSPIDAIAYRLDSKDVLFLVCAGHKLICWNGETLEEYPDSPAILSMTVHYERLFVTSRDERTRVYFSENLDPRSWNISAVGGGFIDMTDERGFSNKVVSFGNYLYVFRDHGISRITAFGDQSEFSVVHMFVTAGRIYPSSITICGDRIMFLASDGLYAFDGYECRRVLENLSGLIAPDDDCASAYFDGRYYLACRMDFADGLTVGCEASERGANGLLVFDPTSGEYSVSRGLNIRYMYAASYNGEDFLMCCESGMGGVIARCGKRFSAPLPKHWKGPASKLGKPDKIKSVSDVCLDSDCNAMLTVEMDGRSVVCNIVGTGGRYRTFISGKTLSIAIDVACAECNITPVTVIYSVR